MNLSQDLKTLGLPKKLSINIKISICFVLILSVITSVQLLLKSNDCIVLMIIGGIIGALCISFVNNEE